MAIATKHRRRIRVFGREFVWWVAPDEDSPALLLRIASSDKSFLVHFAVGQPAERSHVVVIGRDFPAVADAGGRWIRVRAPAWHEKSVTPALVRRIIEWCLDPTKEVVRMEWRELA
jgi:hypothetical protein